MLVKHGEFVSFHFLLFLVFFFFKGQNLISKHKLCGRQCRKHTFLKNINSGQHLMGYVQSSAVFQFQNLQEQAIKDKF
jgi:hypothetical protein